ncbi:ASB14 [Mytilus edulis]|uniref:ASB14 n=1 Tax=Mytilus edulis TaxID=6550 RepID=A0A8S3U806_MYTED|nr:ASB14 [Mytilus edulis]
MDQRQRNNFYKSISGIGIATQSACHVFEQYLISNGQSLEDFINLHRHDICHLCYNKVRCPHCTTGYHLPYEKVLCTDQLNDLFDSGLKLPCHAFGNLPKFYCCESRMGIQIKDLDLTLIRCLLVNFCQDLFWINCLNGGIFEDFLNNNKHDIFHMWQGHRAAREMTHMVDAEFNDIWKEIEDVICNLITHGIHDTSVATQIKDEQTKELVSLKNKILDELEEKRRQRIAFTELEIERQMKRNNFVKTRAVDEAIKIMESQNMVVLTGSAGSGKSATAIYLLRHFQTNKNYKPLKILTFADLSILINPNSDEPVIVLLEDIFGRTNYTYVENSERNVLGELGTCIGNTLKVIITIRTTIMKSCMSLFYTSNVFCGLHVVDLSRDFQLVKTEKKRLLERYLELNNILVSECGNCMDDQLQPDAAVTISNKVIDEIVQLDTVGVFPENCRLFTTIRCFTRLGIKFFRHPTISLRNEIDALRRADGNDNISTKLKYKFTALVYMLLSNDVLSKNSLDFCKVQDIFKSVNGGCTIIEHLLIDAADDMIDQYLTYSSIENAYYFQHRIIAEAVMISYSKCNISQVISMLNQDFIAEMVKPDCYIEKEGEVVLKVPSNNYRHLAKVIKELLLLKSIGACFIEYILTKSEIFENVEFLQAIVETFEYLFKPKDSLSSEDIELKTSVCKLLDLTFKKTASLDNLACFQFICVFIRVDKEKNQMELLEWMVWNSNQMFIKQCLEKTFYYQSHFLETLVACCNDDDDVTIVEWLLDHYNLNRLNIKKAFENICEFWDMYKNILKTLLKTSANDDNELTKLLLCAAFKTGNLESASFIIHRVDLRTFDFRAAVSIACNNHAFKIIEWLLEQSFFMQISSLIEDLPVIRILKWKNLPQSSSISRVLNDSILVGDYGIDLITDRIKSFRILALNVFKYVAKSSIDSQQSFVQSCHRTNFDIEGVFLDACKSNEFLVLEMVLNYYDEETFGQLIKKAGDDLSSLNFYPFCHTSKLPSVILQNTPIGSLHKNPSLFHFAAKEGDIEKVKIFLNEVECGKLFVDKAFFYSLNNPTLQVTELLLNKLPISDFQIYNCLQIVIKEGKTDCFQLLLRHGNIDLLDIDDLLTVIITEGKCKGLLLDVLKRNISKLNLQKKLQNKFFLAMTIWDLEVFEFLFRNVDHENIDAKEIVIESIKQEKFDVALLILRNVSVNVLNMTKEVIDELVNAIDLQDKMCVRRILMSFPEVDFMKLMYNAIINGDESYINDILMILDEDKQKYKKFKFYVKEFMKIALEHKQLSTLKIFVEHRCYICNLDVKLELIAFAEKGKTKICELYLEVIDTYYNRFTLTSEKTPVMNRHIVRLFERSFADDHIEHQLMSRLYLMDLLDLTALFKDECCFLFFIDHHTKYKLCSMILINFSEDVVDRLITITRFDRYELKVIFSYVCRECKEGKQFIATISRLEKRYGTSFYKISKN